jgi:uncharacterized protein
MPAVTDALDLLASPLAHERAARGEAHRPWSRPGRSWVMAQTWMDLLFAHWSVEPGALARFVPDELPLDTFDGRAWIAVTPFAVRNLRLRPTLPVPLVSSFPEINVRTYVTLDDKPGIYFFSLDAASRLGVAAARRFYRLPYFPARMRIERSGDEIRYSSERTQPPVPAEFRASYRPTGPVFRPHRWTLEHWLAERYCLYTLDERHRVLRGEIHHPPWPLQPATVEIAHNSMGHQVGIELEGDPIAHFAHRQDVIFWPLGPAESGG